MSTHQVHASSHIHTHVSSCITCQAHMSSCIIHSVHTGSHIGTHYVVVAFRARNMAHTELSPDCGLLHPLPAQHMLPCCHPQGPPGWHPHHQPLRCLLGSPCFLCSLDQLPSRELPPQAGPPPTGWSHRKGPAEHWHSAHALTWLHRACPRQGPCVGVYLCKYMCVLKCDCILCDHLRTCTLCVSSRVCMWSRVGTCVCRLRQCNHIL